MIHYQVSCSAEHEFDGWFLSGASFEEQAAAGFIECPICGDSKVKRALMKPSVPRKRGDEPRPANRTITPAGEPAAVAAGGQMPDHMRAMLQKLRAEVERNCDYVGPDFAEEARKIHRGESERRGIYGETTPDQAESLADEGIEVGRIPWVRRAES